MRPAAMQREAGNVIERSRQNLSQELSQRSPTLTDGNDAEMAQTSVLLTLTDATTVLRSQRSWVHLNRSLWLAISMRRSSLRSDLGVESRLAYLVSTCRA